MEKTSHAVSIACGIIAGLALLFWGFIQGVSSKDSSEHIICLEIVQDKDKCNQIFGLKTVK